MKTAGKIVGGIVALMIMFFFGLTVGMMGHATPAPVTVSQPAPAVQAAPEPTPAPAEAPGTTHPFVSFTDGTYEIGVGDGQVVPGKYTVGAAAGSVGNYYEVTDAHGKILKNDYTSGPTFVTVATGQILKVSGGGLWVANSGW